MASFSQANRPLSFRVHNPKLDADALVIERLKGTEAVSELFDFQVDLLAADGSVSFDEVLNQSATVTIAEPGGRFFSGIVRSFEQRGPRMVAGLPGTRWPMRYRAHLVPALWRLTRRVQSRVLRRDGIQQMTVPELLEQVLVKEWGLAVTFQMSDQRSYRRRDHLVQYRESDFALVSRLMEEEGLWYCFQHQADGHRLIVTDTMSSAAERQPLVFNADPRPLPGRRIHSWKKRQEVRSNGITLQDYCFQLADKKILSAAKTATGSVTIGTASHRLSHPHGAQDLLQRCDYPAHVSQRFDGIDKGGEESGTLSDVYTEMDRSASLRLEEETARGFDIRGRGNYPHLTAGLPIKLTDHLDADDTYVLTRVEHRASQRGAFTSGTEVPFTYENRFGCLPAALPYRPRRRTPKPRIEGTQTAVVVAPAGQPAFLDKFGRVKVLFRWDRGEAAAVGDRSCWVRVAQVWAGKGWGAFFWPREGQEVVVTFEDGDPEKPLITGSVYNNVNMPPANPQEQPHLAGFKSCTLGAPALERCNSVVLDDLAGREHVFIHSETHSVDTCEATRFVYSPAPSVEILGELPFPIPGSGSGGGTGYQPLGLLNYTMTGSFIRDWAKLGQGAAFKNLFTAQLNSFPVKSSHVAGNVEQSCLFGDRRTHVTGGAHFVTAFDPMELWFFLLGNISGLGAKAALAVKALKIAMDPLGELAGFPPPMSGLAEMAWGPRSEQTYFGARTQIVRGPLDQFHGRMFAHSAALNADLTAKETRVFALITLLLLTRLLCDIMTLAVGSPKKEDPTEIEANAWTALANGLGVSRLHSLLKRYETALAKQEFINAKEAELKRSRQVLMLTELMIEKTDIQDARRDELETMFLRLDLLAAEQQAALTALQA